MGPVVGGPSSRNTLPSGGFQSRIEEGLEYDTLDAIPKVPRHPGLSRGEHRGSRHEKSETQHFPCHLRNSPVAAGAELVNVPSDMLLSA